MGAQSDILGNFGSPHQLTWNGKTYQFRKIDQVMEDTFEKRLYERHKASLRDLKDDYPQGEYVKRLNELGEMFADSLFELFAEHGQKFLKTPRGKFMLLGLICGVDEDEARGLAIANSEEVESMTKLIFYESFPGMEAKIRAMEAEQEEKKKKDQEQKELEEARKWAMETAQKMAITKEEIKKVKDG